MTVFLLVFHETKVPVLVSVSVSESTLTIFVLVFAVHETKVTVTLTAKLGVLDKLSKPNKWFSNFKIRRRANFGNVFNTFDETHKLFKWFKTNLMFYFKRFRDPKSDIHTNYNVLFVLD